MVIMKNLLLTVKYGITEGFPAARWCLFVIAAAFSAVVCIYRYIDLSDMAATSFSSLETLFLVLNDAVNIIFIYLPSYLFIISGIVSNSNFGAADIIKSGSRKKWLLGKMLVLLINTIIFFIILFGINIIIINRVFPFSDKWSSGFISFRVMTGSPALDFKYTPLGSIMFFIIVTFFIYFLCGIINILIALITDHEETALLVSLSAGIGASILNLRIPASDAFSLFIKCCAVIAVTAVIYIICIKTASKKDYNISKKTSLY